MNPDDLACDVADRLDAIKTLLQANADNHQIAAVLADARRIVSQIIDWQPPRPVAEAEVRQ